MKETDIGYLIKLKRTEFGLSQAELSKKMNWKTGQFISNIERGQSFPPVKSAKKLCRILKIDTSVFVEAYIYDIKQRLEFYL